MLGLSHSKAVCPLSPPNTMLSEPLPSWSCLLLPLEFLGSPRYPQAKEGSQKAPCAPRSHFLSAFLRSKASQKTGH